MFNLLPLMYVHLLPVPSPRHFRLPHDDDPAVRRRRRLISKSCPPATPIPTDTRVVVSLRERPPRFGVFVVARRACVSGSSGIDPRGVAILLNENVIYGILYVELPGFCIAKLFIP